VRAAPASSPVAVTPAEESPGLPGIAFALPNPAHGTATLRVRSAAARPPGSRATLYSVAGRRLATLDATGEGESALRWDGRDTGGRPVPPGIVLVRVHDATGTILAEGRFVWLP
jgi:hypothetical protein